jgi:hypothetical protein
MTMILDEQSAEPGTHALLIGVGDYPWLADGSKPQAERFSHPMKMGQLSSPPLSVEALANWLTDANNGFNNPERPLRSLELLCSAATPFTWTPPGGAAMPIDRAERATAAKAIVDWKRRADRNPENIALLYFCGHGLAFSASQNSLLLGDFGSNGADPMVDAIAIDSLRLGLQRHCAARYQCLFIDACRNPPTTQFIDTFGDENAGAAVIAGGVKRTIGEKLAPVYFATGLASVAYGQPDQPSIFMQGLLKSFRGVASREAADHYAVIFEALAEGINKCVESLAFAKVPQFCQAYEAGYPFALHHVRGDPEVIVKVFTKDERLLPAAILSHTRQDTNKHVERPPQPAPWWVPLPLGKYVFKAVSAQGAALIGEASRDVAPPGGQVAL